MSSKVGTLKVGLEMDSGGFITGIASAHRAMRNFEDMVEDVALAVKRMAEATIEAGFEMVATLQKTEISLAGMTSSGEEATQMMEKLKAFAISTPFNFEEVVSATQKLHGMGVAASDVIPLMQLIGDETTAIGGGQSEFNRITRDLGEIIAQGNITKRNLNSLNTMFQGSGIVAEAVRKPIEGMLKMVEHRAVSSKVAIKALLEAFLLNNGAMQKMTGTLVGAWAQAKDQALLFLGTAMLPLARHLVMLLPQVMTLGAAFSTWLTPLLDGLITAVDWLTVMLQMFNALPASYQENVIAVALLAAGLGLATIAGMGFFFALSATLSALLAVGAAISIIGLPVFMGIAAGMLAVVNVVAVLISAVAMFSYAWIRDWGHIREHLRGVVSWMSDVFNALYVSLDGILTSIYRSSLKTAKGVIEVLQASLNVLTKADPPLPWIKKLQTGLADGIKLLDEISAKFEANGGFAGSVQNIAGQGAGALKNLLAQQWNETGKDVSAFINGPLKELFANILPADAKKVFEDWLSGAGSAAGLSDDEKAALQKWIDDFTAGLNDGSGGDEGKATAKALKASIADAMDYWTHLIAEIKPKAQQAKETADQVIKGLKEATADWLQNIKDAAKDNRDFIAGFFSGGAGTSGLDLSSLNDAGNSFSSMADQQAKLLAEHPEQMGKMTTMFSDFAGVIGNVVGVLLAILTKTKTFIAILTQFGLLIDSVVAMFSKMQNGSVKLINVTVKIIDVVIKLALQLTGMKIAINLWCNMLGYIGAAMTPLMLALRQFAQVIDTMSGAQKFANNALSASGHLLFEAFKAAALIITAVAQTMGTAWNTMLNAIIDVLNVFKGLSGVKKLIKNLKGMLSDTTMGDGSLDDLWNMTWEDANALAEHGMAVKDATDAMHSMTAELLNVPEGYKVALTRFNNAAGTGLGSTLGAPGNKGDSGSSGGGSYAGSSGSNGGHAGGGGGGKSQQDAQMRSAQGGSSAGGIVITNAYIYANNVDELWEQLQTVGARKGLVQGGRVFPKAGSKFSTPR